MSRRNSHEGEFGSDAFLDVLANMVGILIILVVIAGVRVDRGPTQAAVQAAVAGLATPPLASIQSPSAELQAPAVAPEPEPESDGPPAALTAELRSIESDAESFRLQQADNDAELEKVRSRYETARLEASAAEKAAAKRLKELEGHQARLARLQQSLGERKEALAALLAEFEEARNARSPVKQVKHRLAPISQEVEGEEVHFRLKDNRVSVIPLPQLVERVKFQLERQKEFLSRHVRHEGTVGPVDGFSMRYVVERQQLSAMEERRLGYGAFRVSVSRWELVPERDLAGETAEQALRRGSRFVTALQAAPERASLTFWVYPDSFHLYRTLQEAAHAEGFIVAGRPLPDGAAIEGSPYGSRSAGQ